MKNLDNNPRIAHPKNMVVICAILPFLLGAMCAVIASEATPRRTLLNAPLSLFCLCLCPLAILGALMPKFFDWDWRTKYFGVSAIYFSSVSLLGIIPWLCILLYGSLPLWGKTILFVYYVVPNIWWCGRFVIYYKKIYFQTDFRNMLFMEESDAIYYYQKHDNWLIEKNYKFKLYPSSLFFISPMALAFLCMPWMQSIKFHVGLPFLHAFLTVCSLPLVMTVLGLTVKSYLVFFHYPQKIKFETGKDVYIDMVSRTIPQAKRHSLRQGTLP